MNHLTIAQVIARVQELKPNAVARETQVGWLSEVDEMIFRELVKTHRFGQDLLFDGYSSGAESGTDEIVLLAPEPYSRLYVFWLMSQIDLQQQEYDLYANDAALYNRAWADYRNYYNRCVPPLGVKTLKRNGLREKGETL